MEELETRDYAKMENPSLLRFLVDMRGEEVRPSPFDPFFVHRVFHPALSPCPVSLPCPLPCPTMPMTPLITCLVLSPLITCLVLSPPGDVKAAAGRLDDDAHRRARDHRRRAHVGDVRARAAARARGQGAY